jgi:[FeFe] hydrogenase H-cluster maturation GTPase HydF
MTEEDEIILEIIKAKKTPYVIVMNKVDLLTDMDLEEIASSDNTIFVSTVTNTNIHELKELIAKHAPKEDNSKKIVADLLAPMDFVILVIPIDSSAPKGRLILPQVQTIRELLDKKCIVMSVTTDQMLNGLSALKNPPKLIITDSQVFDFVYEHKPAESMLTSFSVLFAAYKGDISYYIEGAKAMDSLTATSRVLIAECCTHAPLSEDIGRVKIPALLRKRFGETLQVDIASGTDYPQDLSAYDLIIQCGACMFNRRYVLARIDRAKEQKIPMTNYGVTIAHLTGILDKIVVDCK